MSARLRGLLLALLSPVLGCFGSDLQSVQGRVTLKGEPIQGAVVVFHPVDATIHSQRPSGTTDSSGNYTLATGPKPGSSTGEYVVTIVWPGEPPPLPKGMSTDMTPPEVQDRLKGRYSNVKTSTLKASVKPGSNSIPTFELQ
jgi:hypothetical protein